MSYQDGWSALTLDMPARVPHTEYSLEMHFDVIKAVTEIHVNPSDSDADKRKAGIALARALNYDLVWSTLISGSIFGEKKTDMGHAVYEEGGTDYRNRLVQMYEDPQDALKFDPWELYGPRDHAAITGQFNAHYARQTDAYPNAVNMTGIYVTCMSGLIEVFGWDTLLCAAGIDAEGFGAVANRYGEWILTYYEALAASDAPVVMVHDDIVWTSGAFIHPEWYRRFIFPNYKRLFRPLLDAGKRILFTSDGDYTQFVDDIAACGVNGFVMEPMTDMAYIAQKYGKTHSFIGNADTRILLSGSKQDIEAEVKRCMDIGKSCPGFFMAVGNHIPPNTPLESVLYYLDAYERLSKR